MQIFRKYSYIIYRFEGISHNALVCTHVCSPKQSMLQNSAAKLNHFVTFIYKKINKYAKSSMNYSLQKINDLIYIYTQALC